jgi:hypothetical protein
MDRGWTAYVTLYAMEKNCRADGVERVFLNSTDLSSLRAELNDAFSNAEWADFIIALRINGPAQNPMNAKKGVVADFDLTTAQSSFNLTSVADLIGSAVNVTDANGTQQVWASPFEDNPIAMSVYLPLLMDGVTTVDQPTIPCRININQAPRSLLDGIPNITPEIVDAIIEARGVEPDPNDKLMKTEAWILAKGIVTPTEYKSLSAFICAGGDVFRAQVIGYYESGGSSARAEVVFDATGDLPRILFWRDISHLGRGYPVETLGISGSTAVPTAGS